MGKKKSYKLKEYERYEKRVDIFRSVQPNAQKTSQNFTMSSPGAKIMLMRGANGYTNKSFVSSETTSSQSDDRKKIWTTQTPHASNLNLTEIDLNMAVPATTKLPNLLTAQPAVSNNQRPGKSEFYPPVQQFNEQIPPPPMPLPPPPKDRFNYKINKSKPVKSRASSSKKCLRWLGFSVMGLIIVALIGALVFLVIKNIEASKKNSAYITNNCRPECRNENYCVHSNLNLSAPSCNCKPGYTKDANTHECKKSTCFENYVPYTFVNNYANSSTIPLPYNTLELTPHCCPHKNYFSSACCGVATSALNARNIVSSKRIIGGSVVNKGSVFPWMVYITQLYRGASTNGTLTFLGNCTGSLISDRVVLTAAHCTELDMSVVKFNSEFPNAQSIIKVYVGLSNVKNVLNKEVIAQYQRSVKRIFVNQAYNKTTFQNDLALLFLDSPVLRDENVDFICLFNYKYDDSFMKNRLLFTAGWGSITPSYESLTFSNDLRYIDANVYNMNECKYIFPGDEYTYLFDDKTHVCAGHNDRPIDTCYGDSGSPLMVQLNNQWFIYGNFNKLFFILYQSNNTCF